MSGIPLVPEQDRVGDDNLPTYDDLAAQNGPNSRFGRWKGWVEKRAAERYIDVTPEDRARRRARGWGDSVHEDDRLYSIDTSSSFQSNPFGTNDSRSSIVSDSASDPQSYAFEQNTPILPTSEPLPPSHARLYSFGSRFLPHTTWPINALLPLMGDRLLLIGHDNGLSVMDMFPSGDPETSGPGEALVRPIWEGEGVYQLDLLEFQDTGDGTPHGVVLVLIGVENESANSKERDVTRVVRMYNLSSLTSLARWAVIQQIAKPIDLRQSASWSPQQTQSKKHKHNSSIVKLRSLVLENAPPNEPNSPFPQSGRSATQLKRGISASSEDSAWDTVEDLLPLRWATDFVPLASSKRLQSNVIFFELKRNESNAGNSRSSTLLAIATKTNILLYETPKGERAFRFVKEFYAPVPPRGLSFVQQHVQEAVVLRSLSSSSARSSSVLEDERRFNLRSSLDVSREYGRPVSPVRDYGAQLSLFVVFEKKAGLIRLSDSFVGEVELSEDVITSPLGGSPRRSFVREQKALWLPPSYEEVLDNSPGQPNTIPIYLLTRGKQTHIVKAPLSIPLSSSPPLTALNWHHQPSHISHRVCSPFREPPYLQVIAFGQYGIEVQEVPLSIICGGKGKSRRAEPVCAQIDIGGDVGFLCRGGQWNKPLSYLLRADSFMSYGTNGTVRRNAHEKGFYGWLRRDLEDWRVFWVGDSSYDDIDSFNG